MVGHSDHGGPTREPKLGLVFPWEPGRGGEGWLGWERAGFRIGKDKDRGSALEHNHGHCDLPTEKGT